MIQKICQLLNIKRSSEVKCDNIDCRNEFNGVCCADEPVFHVTSIDYNLIHCATFKQVDSR